MKAAATAIAAAAPAARSATVAPANAGRCAAATHAELIWTWLGEIPDPEIPVISIVDLGIVRDVRVAADGACDVTITPTYSGCPAMQVIADAITAALRAHGVATVRLHNQLSPAWTTDWMSETGKAALRNYGIAPPAQQVIDLAPCRARADGGLPALRLHPHRNHQPVRLHALQSAVQMPGLPRTVRLLQVPLKRS
jgi:ring-1,2-phenylacetyl-CoA epoxidase subunit PaaD